MTGDSGEGGDKPVIALEAREAKADARLHSPSAARNRDVIRDAFLEFMPYAGRILEIGSGTGQHAVHILTSAPELRWSPSDPDGQSRASIAAWAQYEGVDARMDTPRIIDAAAEDWAIADPDLDADPGADAGDEEVPGVLDGMMACNMIHISPWAAGRGLIAGAGRYLKPGGRLFLYGPYSRNGVHTSPSNAAFDQDLKRRNPDWGVRDLEGDVLPLAAQAGLSLVTVRQMPANNICVVFEKSEGAPGEPPR